MHLLILTHVFHPDFSGAATMQYEMAKHMASAGHKVTVVASYSQHHMSVNTKPLHSEELMDGIRVLRVRSLINLDSSRFFQRALGGFIKDIGVVSKGLQCGPADVVFVMSPPITLPIVASIFKLLRKSVLVLNVQDIFPELVIAMGILRRNSLAIRFGELVEKLAYACADYIGVHSPKNRLHIISRGVPEEKVNVLPLWVDTDLVEPRPRCNPFSESHGLNDKFVVLYAGTIGFAMGAQTIPQTAGLLAKEKNIQFIVIGGGSKLDEMNDEIKKHRANNILMFPPQPREDFPDVLASADVLLVTLRKEITDNPNGYFRAVVPHKLLTNMASARPILLAAEETSDAAEIIRISQCGKIVPPEDSVLLAKAIMEMYEGQELLSNWGRNGRAFVTQHFDSKTQVERLEKLFLNLCGDKSYRMNNPWVEGDSKTT
jgi:colanic acid biosynthesis glycosyl transferase WcaI